jgi:hypothetical protein
MLIQFPGIPLGRMAVLAEVSSSSIQDIHFPSNPLICMIEKRASHETVSKALLKSNFKIIAFFLRFLHVKWITKILATRLQAMIKLLVGADQSGFVKTRCIADNFMYAMALVQSTLSIPECNLNYTLIYPEGMKEVAHFNIGGHCLLECVV